MPVEMLWVFLPLLLPLIPPLFDFAVFTFGVIHDWFARLCELTISEVCALPRARARRRAQRRAAAIRADLRRYAYPAGWAEAVPRSAYEGATKEDRAWLSGQWALTYLEPPAVDGVVGPVIDAHGRLIGADTVEAAPTPPPPPYKPIHPGKVVVKRRAYGMCLVCGEVGPPHTHTTAEVNRYDRGLLRRSIPTELDYPDPDIWVQTELNSYRWS